MIQELVYTPFVTERMTTFQRTILESVGCSLPSEVKKQDKTKQKTLHKGKNCYYSLIAFDPEELV